MSKPATVIRPSRCQCGAIGLLQHTGPVPDSDLTGSKITYRCGRLHVLHWRVVGDPPQLDVQHHEDLKPCPNKSPSSPAP